METESEWRWFGQSVRDSLLRPRRFAAALGEEHFGLAGVLVVVIAGVALSLLAMGLVLQDQLGRTVFTTLTFAPQVLPPPAAAPASGRDVTVEGATFRVPADWRDAQRGVPGVAADYELPDARLVVRITDVATLTTADAFASSQVQGNLRDFTSVDHTERGLVRIDRAAALDDRWFGDIRGARLVERQYAFVVGRRGYIFEFTFYAPRNDAAALAQAASIAASIRLG